MIDLIEIAKRMEHILRNIKVTGILDMSYDLEKGLKVSSYIEGFTKVTLEIPHDGVTAFLHNDIPSITGEIEEGQNMDELHHLRAIAKSVMSLNFGASPALPWCRESFPHLDSSIKDYEKYLEERGDD